MTRDPVRADARVAGGPRKPLVLYVDYSLGFGGAIKSLSLTLGALQDVEKLVVTSQDPAIVRAWLAPYPVLPFRRLLNYRTYDRLRSRADRRLPAASWLVSKALAVADLAATGKNALWFYSLLRRRGVALVHANNGFVPPEIFRACRWARVPCIVHLRDIQREPGPADSAWGQGVARVIAVSGAVGRSLERTAIPADRVTVVHDPVDVAAIDDAADAREGVRARWRVGASDLLVAIFGRVIPWKGQREFARAAVEAIRRDARIRPMIVGDESDGGAEYVAEVRAIAEASGFGDRFIFAGYQERVEEYYAAADIVVHASITPEPFGMVVPEAMAAGRAVVAADAGGPREVVTPGEDGLLVTPGDVDGLAAAILELAADGARREAMGRRGREKVLAEFTVAANNRRIRAVYDSVLRAPASAAATEVVP